ncbi:MAG TPA: hypothetical protein VH369_16615, partial [Bryobacteraceae bacterium]
LDSVSLRASALETLNCIVNEALLFRALTLNVVDLRGIEDESRRPIANRPHVANLPHMAA